MSGLDFVFYFISGSFNLSIDSQKNPIEKTDSVYN